MTSKGIKLSMLAGALIGVSLLVSVIAGQEKKGELKGEAKVPPSISLTTEQKLTFENLSIRIELLNRDALDLLKDVLRGAKVPESEWGNYQFDKQAGKFNHIKSETKPSPTPKD